MLRICPDPIDVQDIQFKLHCSLKIFNNSNLETFSNNHNLISCASRYGLLFVGSNTPSLKVVQLKTVENFNPKEKEISIFPRRNIVLPSAPKHLCVNCDSTILAVVVEKDNCPVVIFYDVLSFYKQNVSIVKEVRLSASPGTYATEVNWNPALPNTFTACKSDGSLGNYELKGDSIDINELPPAAESTSFCWSPKGKQIAVGSRNGKITQYKPDLKPVKLINAPIFEGPHSLISLCWVSNYQFIGVYQSAAENGQAKLVVVDAPKTGETTYTNYDDVCYSGCSRTPQFYLILLQHWNMLMIASSNSMELGLLGAVSEVWTQWNVPDFARAELPLGADKQDTLPIGMALDISSTKPLPWGEGSIPPCPYLLLLSHQGVLYFFNIVNLKEGMPSICTPPDTVGDMSGVGQFIVESQQTETKSIPQQPPSASAFSFAPQTTPALLPANPILSIPTLPPQTSLPAQTPQTTFSFATPPSQPLSFGLSQSTAAPNTSLFTKPTETKSLFGGQITLAPIKPPQPAATSTSMFGNSSIGVVQQSSSSTSIFGSSTTANPPSTVSASIFGNASIPAASSSTPLFGNSSISITPISKPQSVENSEKYSTIFAALKAPSVIPQPVETKPIVISAQVAKPDLPVQESPKTSIPDTPKSSVYDASKTSVDVKAVLDEKVKGETDALFAKMVRDECIALESELKAMLHQGAKINISIGSDEEKIRIIEDLNDLQDFIKEIVEVSLGESSEVHSLKQNLILSWAWFEEALSRYNISKDTTMNLLLMNQPLDSAAEKRQSDIRKTIYYLESQLYQASKALDEQWDQFQEYAKKTYKTKMPTMETIFQSLVQQNAVLQKQSYIVEYISTRLKHKKLSPNTPSLFLTMDNVTKLEEDLQRLHLDPDDGHRIIYEQTLDRNKKLSAAKRDKLRSLLRDREVSHVLVPKPQLNSSISLLRSPSTRSKQIFSILGAQMSPVAKPSAAKNLQFSESTPVRLQQDFKPTTVPPNTPAQPEASKTFSFKRIENPATAASPSIITITKNTSLFSNLSQSQNSSSAFVPTIPTSKTFIVPQVSAVSTTSSLLSFSFSSKTADSTLTKTSVSAKPTPVIKPDAASAVTTTSLSTTKSAFSFSNSENILSPAKTSSINVPSLVADGNKNLFSFGKISLSDNAASSSSNTSLFSTTTIQPTISLSKTTSAIMSPADSTEKPMSTTRIISSTVQSSTTSSIPMTTVGFAPPATSTITKPLEVRSSAQVITASKANSATSTVATTSTFSFRAPSPTALFGGAVTTTTTSLFGSITTPSVASSVFGAKPVISADSTTSPAVSKGFAVSTSAPLPLKSTSTILSTDTPNKSLGITTASDVSSSSSKPLFVPPTAISTSNSGSIFGAATTSASATTSSPIIPSTTSKTTSIFGGTTVSSSLVSIFGGSTTTIVSSSSPVSSTTQASIFNVAAATMPSSGFLPISIPSVNTTASSAFGSPSTTASISASPSTADSTQSSIFGAPASASTAQATGFVTPVTQGSIFSTPASTPQGSIFSTPVSTTQGSIFATPSTTQASVFGSPTTQSSIFGGTTAATSIFGTSTSSPSGSAPASTTQSIFSTPTTEASAFGSTTTQPSIFGGSTTAQSSIFGNSVGSSAPAPVFGTTVSGAVAPAFGKPTTSSPVFGAPPSPSGSIFGGTPASQTPAFGSASTTSSQSIFGSAAPAASSSSIFGAPSATTPAFGAGFSQSGSIFGGDKTTANTFGSAFGSPSAFGAAPTTTAAFGQPAAFGTNSGSIFGTPTTSTSVFGSNSNNFGAVSTSNNAFGSGSTSSFSFAQAANTGSLGFGDLTVNSNAASGGSLFGGTSTFGQAPANPFARNTDQKSPFGTAATTFGTPSSTTGSIFGAASGTSFGSNSQNTFGGSSFGSPSGFGQQPTFGQSTGFTGGSSFGSTNAQPGPFSSSAVGVGQTGFGSPGAFQKTGGFGAAPVFGGSPQSAFGASPTFGGTPAFGGAPTFGSPPKVFGSTTPAAAFGQGPTTASPGFGQLATQNTVGFGSLAQQAATPTSTAFSGSSSFSSWR